MMESSAGRKENEVNISDMSLKSKAHGFCFYPRINICAFADWRSDLRSVALWFFE